MKNTFVKFVFGFFTAVLITSNALAIGDHSIGEFAPRDPRTLNIVQRNEPNLYGFVRNDPLNSIDALGLWATDVHHQIVDDWLPSSYEEYEWRCCKLNVRKAIKNGSDSVDGAGAFGLPTIGFLDAQSSGGCRILS